MGSNKSLCSFIIHNRIYALKLFQDHECIYISNTSHIEPIVCVYRSTVGEKR